MKHVHDSAEGFQYERREDRKEKRHADDFVGENNVTAATQQKVKDAFLVTVEHVLLLDMAAQKQLRRAKAVPGCPVGSGGHHVKILWDAGRCILDRAS